MSETMAQQKEAVQSYLKYVVD